MMLPTTQTTTHRPVTTILLLSALLLSACAGGAPRETPPPAPANASPQPIKTSQPTQTSVSASTEAPTSAPSGDQEALIEQWSPVVMTYSLLVGACVGGTSAAGKAQTGADASGEIDALGMLTGVIDQSLSGWNPPQSIQIFKDRARGHNQALKDILDQWSGDQIDAEQASAQIGDECDAIQSTFKEVSAAARDQGLTQESMQSIVEDIQKGLTGQ